MPTNTWTENMIKSKSQFKYRGEVIQELGLEKIANECDAIFKRAKKNSWKIVGAIRTKKKRADFEETMKLRNRLKYTQNETIYKSLDWRGRF